eukprot:1161466-Pelagomonas_calceolata.AAC.1
MNKQGPVGTASCCLNCASRKRTAEPEQKGSLLRFKFKTEVPYASTYAQPSLYKGGPAESRQPSRLSVEGRDALYLDLSTAIVIYGQQSRYKGAFSRADSRLLRCTRLCGATYE